MTTRRSMQLADWINTAFLVPIGIFLGIVVDGLAGLVFAGNWLVAVVCVVVAVVAVGLLFLFDGLLGRVIERILPTGIRPAAAPDRGPRKPLLLMASLPAGLALGVVLARLGLTTVILGLP